MSERLTAQFGDNSICAFDLLDRNGQYIEEERSRIRTASQAGALGCPECGSRLILCAGAIREPYFRHFVLEECTATLEMRTKAGKRRYICRKMLYQLAKNSGCKELTLEEGKRQILLPVLFETEKTRAGYVFLDGKSRNYGELKAAARKYEAEEYKLLFFLAMKNMSDGKNITSDEAEIAKLNKGIIYYIDDEKEHIAMRKAYQDANHTRRYFTKKFQASELQVNADGEISVDFLKAYDTFVRAEKRKIDKVLRISAEEGIDELYFDMDYVFMDSLEEIWILPEFKHVMENDTHANENRIAYLEAANAALWELESTERYSSGYLLAKTVSERRNSWEW